MWRDLWPWCAPLVFTASLIFFPVVPAASPEALFMWVCHFPCCCLATFCVIGCYHDHPYLNIHHFGTWYFFFLPLRVTSSGLSVSFGLFLFTRFLEPLFSHDRCPQTQGVLWLVPADSWRVGALLVCGVYCAQSFKVDSILLTALEAVCGFVCTSCGFKLWGKRDWDLGLCNYPPGSEVVKEPFIIKVVRRASRTHVSSCKALCLSLCVVYVYTCL